MNKFYEVHETNSGGWLCNPAGGSYIVIRANSDEEALSYLEGQEWYTESYCECCGARWDDPPIEIKSFEKYPGFSKEEKIQFFEWELGEGYVRVYEEENNNDDD